MPGTDQVAVAFFGEGAVAEGAFHETLNLAAVWRLPLVLACEHNGYAELTPASLHLRARVHRLAEPHGVPGVLVDGNDAPAVRAAAAEAIDAEVARTLDAAAQRALAAPVAGPEALLEHVSS